MEQFRVTFIGDIMCEPLLLKASKQKNGSYDFSSVFANVQKMFSKADFLVGNLETPLAGADAGFTSGLYSFNTPESFADAVKNAGIDVVTIANNHCLDRGVDGLRHTIRVLDEKGICHCGTRPEADENDGVFYFTLGSTKFAIINYTYGTNYALNKNLLPHDDQELVNLLRPQNERIYLKVNKPNSKKSFPKRVYGYILSKFNEEHRTYIKRALKQPYNNPRADDYLDENSAEKYVEKMRNDIIAAKKNADVVFFAPHLGGQFNLNPGAFSRYIVKKAAEAGCDAIVASHPHVVQKADVVNNIPCFYSLGNFSMSPNSVYLLYEDLPQYGIAAHFHIEDKQIVKITFSILKMIETRKKPLTVYPVNCLAELLNEKEREELEKDIRQIYKVVNGCELTGEIIREEYPLQK